jgi:hypothetical protein
MSYYIHKSKQEPNYKVVAKTHQGKKHLIVPVIMMVEGVHHGSHGPLLHQINELGHFPEAWNGMPIVINHPEIDGQPVSANDPEIMEQQTIGRVYHTKVDGHRLRAEAWIDEEKLQQLSAELLAQFQKGELIEVSLGMFSDEEKVTGDWNGETYEAIARNHRPDHLALLPGGVGACSCADGCGIRLNKEGGEITEIKDLTTTTVTTSGTEELFTYTEVDSTESGGNIISKGEGPAPVDIIRTKFSNLNEVKKMTDNVVCAPCIKQKVDALITQGRWTEDDREFLQTFSEAQLDRIVPVEVEKIVEKVVEKEVQVNNLSDEEKAAFADYHRQKKEKHDAKIATIQKNSKEGTWTVEELEGMSEDVLTKIAVLAEKKEVVDYSLTSGSAIGVNESKEAPMPPTGVKFITK